MVLVKYIFVDSQKEKAIELKGKLDTFKDKFDRDLSIEIRIAQIEKKEMDDLMRTLGENSPPLHKPCMQGTRTAILQKIQDDIKNVDGHSVIWIRGSPGVGKSALAASIAAQLRKQNRHVISFRFDRTRSSTINTDALWRAVALDLARLYPSIRQYIHKMVQGNMLPDPYDIDERFKSLIETPLSTLNDIPREKLPVIVVDALDECGGLRHDSSGRDDFEGLVRTLKRWVQVDHLKKLKLVITSRPEDRITFSNSVSIHEIPSGRGVEPEDSASNDIRVFLKSRLDDMKMKPAWIAKALDFLVPGAAGIFIWATTVANFLERDPEGRFAMLEKGDGKGLKSLYSLYSTIIEASFGHDLEEEEIRVVVSVMGAMIFAKQPLDDNVLTMLPEVKITGSDVDRLGLIRKGLMSVIDSGPILRFHHRSFEDFLLSSSFLQGHPQLLAIQDRVYHERELTMLCLRTLISPKLHFNMCELESSIVKNTDIQATAKATIPPLVSYSCQYWADHLVHTPSNKRLMKVVKFVMYEKLLFWMEAMSLLGKTYEGTLVLRRALAWKVCLQCICSNTSLILAGQALNSDHELILFIRDALRFISAFIFPISRCAPQIYISSLSFAPEQSLVAKKFRSRFPNTIVVTEGKPSQWPMIVFTAEHHKGDVRHMVFSPDESTFASISTFNDTCVCDSETGHCISGPFGLRYDESVSGVCFSPDGKHILLKFDSHAVVLDIVTGEEQFRIKGSDFVFIHHDGRIASMHWIDQGGYITGIVVKSWDASNGALICDRLFEVNDVTDTQFSPDGRSLAVGRKSKSVIELWSLEDGKDPRRFSYPPGSVSSFVFSTSDLLMAVFLVRDKIYLWRLDTQEMTSFDWNFNHVPHVIHSALTNYLFIQQDWTVEIWDISVTGPKLIWKVRPPTTSRIWSACPSRDGHRLLVGCEDGSVSMWELDLENLAMSQADTIADAHIPQFFDAYMPQFVAFSHSGKMVATRSEQSRSIEFLDTTPAEVVARMDFEFSALTGFELSTLTGFEFSALTDFEFSALTGFEFSALTGFKLSALRDFGDAGAIAFSPDDTQVAFRSGSRITVCDIMHPDSRVSFDLKGVRILKVAFQTCNDLVVCASRDGSFLLQVWHRQRPAGFECTYSLDTKEESSSCLFLAPDGLTVIFASSSSAQRYSWNHDTTQFHRVCLGGNVRNQQPGYSPDGRLFACSSPSGSHVQVSYVEEPYAWASPVQAQASLARARDFRVQVWDTRTGQLVGEFPTFEVDEIALSPTLINHSPGDRLVAVRYTYGNTIGLFDVNTGHLYAQILGRGIKNMAFIRDGTKLAYYSPGIGLRTWDIADLTDEHWHSIHGYELILQDMRDGWVVGGDNEPLFWVPVEHRDNLHLQPSYSVAIGASRRTATSVDLSNSRLCRKWMECIDSEWLRELKQKEQEVVCLLENFLSWSALKCSNK